MPDFGAIIAGPNLGPIFVKQEKQPREKYAHEQGETCSLTDRVYQDNGSNQKLNEVDYEHAEQEIVKTIPKHKEMIAEYKKMILEHVERRILFFFQQLIVCYQTKLHFESIGALDQGKSAEAIVLSVKDHLEKIVVRQAAHSSSNPCLVAYDSNQWKQYVEKKICRPQGFVFLKDTDYYRTVNATMNMPRWMNDADREIDEKTIDSLLRSKGEDIINRVAQGLLTPDEGLTEYFSEAIGEVQKAQKRLSTAKKGEEVQEILGYYEKYLTRFKNNIVGDTTFLEQYLNLKTGHGTQNEKAKRVLFQLRYAAIRDCQVNQAALIQKVEKVRESILSVVKAGNRNRKPDNFDAASKTLLVAQARTDRNRQRLEKLLNFSPFNFEAQLQGSAKIKYFKTKELLAKDHIQKINAIAREVLEDMRKLRTQEMYQRAQTVKELRAMKQWTQKQLGNEVKSLFPLAAASQSTIHRVEKGEKLVTQQIAREFSRVFDVDEGLFMPHFYYE